MCSHAQVFVEKLNASAAQALVKAGAEFSQCEAPEVPIARLTKGHIQSQENDKQKIPCVHLRSDIPAGKVSSGCSWPADGTCPASRVLKVPAKSVRLNRMICPPKIRMAPTVQLAGSVRAKRWAPRWNRSCSSTREKSSRRVQIKTQKRSARLGIFMRIYMKRTCANLCSRHVAVITSTTASLGPTQLQKATNCEVLARLLQISGGFRPSPKPVRKLLFR